MELGNQTEVAQDSLAKVAAYFTNENYGRAFAHYLVYLELLPENKDEHEDIFCKILHAWGLILEERNQLEDLCKCYLQALRHFPSSVKVLTDFGTHLLRLDQAESAEEYLETAYALDNESLPTEKAITAVKLNLVPRWHFRMLNDYKRHQAFLKAIQHNISPTHSKILDIGTGCGILSLFATTAENTDTIITAIESSKTLCKIASNIFNSNGQQRIKLIQTDSVFLHKTDLNRYNLLVTEIFDAGLFGERALDTLIHAWENILEPSAKVIPHSADVYVTGISSCDLLSKHKFLGAIMELNLRELCVIQVKTEPYEGETLGRNNVTYLTRTEKLLTVDFSNVSQLKRLFNDDTSIPNITVTSLADGILHAFAIWFDLCLDSEVKISTSPLVDDVTCWEQAVIYLDHPIKVRKNETLELKVSCVGNRLELQVLNDGLNCEKCFRVSPDIITFLNDSEIVTQLLHAAHVFKNAKLHVLDLLPFPLFSLLLAKRGATVYFSPRTAEDEEFLRHVCKINNIQERKFITQFAMTEKILEISASSYNVIISLPVSKEGVLCEKTLTSMVLFRKLLKPNGLLLPLNCGVTLEIIESEYLEHVNSVDDKNVFGFKIAQYMNEYAVSEHWVINTKTFLHRKLSTTATCDITANVEEVFLTELTIPIVYDGKANGVLYWFDINLFDVVSINTYNSAHYSCACFLFDEPKIVKKGDSLTVVVKQHQGLMKMYCK